jgi:hypothetical protein
MVAARAPTVRFESNPAGGDLRTTAVPRAQAQRWSIHQPDEGRDSVSTEMRSVTGASAAPLGSQLLTAGRSTRRGG